MDAMWWLNHLWVLLACIGGWLLRTVWDAVQELKKDLHELEVELPQHYVTKADLAPMLMDIKQALVRIEARLDEKADK
jgi:hypothetical protein